MAFDSGWLNQVRIGTDITPSIKQSDLFGVVDSMSPTFTAAPITLPPIVPGTPMSVIINEWTDGSKALSQFVELGRVNWERDLVEIAAALRLANTVLTEEMQIARELIATLSQRPLAMSGDVPSTDEVRTDRNPEPPNPVRDHVDAVIEDLTGRKVAARDRERLGDALSDANEALRGRDGADTALGNAIGKPRSALVGLRTGF